MAVPFCIPTSSDIALHAHQHLVLSVSWICHSKRCVVLSFLCFNLHFPDDKWCGAPFHMLLCYLYIWWGDCYSLLPTFFPFSFFNSFLALLDFHCFVRAFSSWIEWLVCAWASCYSGFFCLGAWALGLGASVVVARHLIGIFIFLLSSVQYFGWQSFIRYVFCKHFLPVCGLSSHSLDHIAEQTFTF